MVDNQLQHRLKLYYNLSSQIAQIDNEQLHALFREKETQSSWGENHVIDVGRSKVFVKRIPVTGVEYSNMFSTRNMYDLPTYYNYGFNSAGLGMFRELVTHIRTTNWVLSGVIAAFPLLYHYRIIPFVGVRAEVAQERLAEYVAYWGNNANVGRYLIDRASANYELLLFLEYFPHTVGTWLLDNPARIPSVVADVRETITFLRNNGILHLDSHFHNMLTDGKRVYLTDFGLALDKHFELTPAERRFYKQNSYYDYGNLLWSLQSPLAGLYRRLPDADKNRISERYEIGAGAKFDELISILLNNIEDLHSSGIMKVEPDYLVLLVRYRTIITLMHAFYANMQSNNAKDTEFDQVTLRRLLKGTGFVPSL